ncbi:MAG: agmatine deiminase family protein, partial [Deltaproteobacteria bacterium]|nr:agmatine deiminase family protein [Deltaproteobacteria bacterium]
AQDCINYNILEENYSILLKTTTVDGKPLKIVRIPMPDNSDGVWRTYTNSLFVNNIALVPVYSQHKTYETEAIEAYKTALGNNWKIITIDSEEIIPDGGAIHCITMTVPDFSLVKFQNDPEPLCGNSINCSPSGCGTITTKGECDGDVVLWCESNAPNFYDCSSPCNMVPNGYPCEQRCEYNNQSGYYDCISDFQCLQCIDECKTGEKGCKDSNTQWVCAGDTDQDGCNEIKTINCNPGETCRNGICQSECTPDCTGKECGDDGCGNACGFCKQNEYCGSDSKCHPNPLDAGTDTSDIKDANTEDIISDITPVDTTDDINSIKDAEGDTFLTDSGNDTITTDIIDNDVSDTGQTDITDAAGHDTGNIDASVRDTIRIDSESEEDKENNTVDNSEGCSCSFIN